MTPKRYDTRSLKGQVKIADLLSRLGHEPTEIAGTELLYKDVLSKTLKPSFCLNNDLDSWFDHSLSKGGDLLDLGTAYWKLPFTETLEKIIALCNLDAESFLLTQVPDRTENRPRLKKATKLPHYVIENILPIGTNPSITAYLKSVGIPGVLDDRLREVYYYKQDEKGKRTQFYSAGWQTENGSWWVKNKYFSGSIGKAGSTYIAGEDAEMLRLEIYLDYFDFVLKNRNSPYSILLLNSYNLLNTTLSRIKKYLDVQINFEDSAEGRKAAEVILNTVPQAKTNLILRSEDYVLPVKNAENDSDHRAMKR